MWSCSPIPRPESDNSDFSPLPYPLLLLQTFSFSQICELPPKPLPIPHRRSIPMAGLWRRIGGVATRTLSLSWRTRASLTRTSTGTCLPSTPRTHARTSSSRSLSATGGLKLPGSTSFPRFGIGTPGSGDAPTRAAPRSRSLRRQARKFSFAFCHYIVILLS